MNTVRHAMHVRAPLSQRAKNLMVSGPLRRRVWLLALIVPTVALAACNAMPTPGRDVNQGQMMLDLNEALNSIRDQSASLQDQVDSLREVVVRQDTIIRQLALTAGIQLPVSR